ncbi:MAG: hypothetical protein JXB14_00510 [Candidatus Altiarchaeota archaeon]|nr:hypothetical protein [Candidatus Altiarchaeota archaeon]
MTKIYESYPATGVILINLFNAIIALLGALILLPYGVHVSLLYLVYVLYLEFQIMWGGCVNCFYYGKMCFCGKGVCAAKLFKKGDAKKFSQKQITWLTLLPTFMIVILPIVCGAILLAIEFDWILLAAIVAIGILGFPAQGITHGWGCGHCKQRELGCPAEKLFQKK